MCKKRGGCGFGLYPTKECVVFWHKRDLWCHKKWQSSVVLYLVLILLFLQNNFSSKKKTAPECSGGFYCNNFLDILGMQFIVLRLEPLGIVCTKKDPLFCILVVSSSSEICDLTFRCPIIEAHFRCSHKSSLKGLLNCSLYVWPFLATTSYSISETFLLQHGSGSSI